MIQASNVKSSLLNVIPLYPPAFRKAPTALPGINILPKYSMLYLFLVGPQWWPQVQYCLQWPCCDIFQSLYTYIVQTYSHCTRLGQHIGPNETQWSPFVSFHPILLHAVRDHSFVYTLVVIFLSEYTYIPRDRHIE